MDLQQQQQDLNHQRQLNRVTGGTWIENNMTGNAPATNNVEVGQIGNQIQNQRLDGRTEVERFNRFLRTLGNNNQQ